MSRPVILVHGGTATVAAPDEPEKAEVLEEAVHQGERLLSDGSSAVEAVVAAVRLMEDSGKFLAGVGGAPQSDGVVRFDASLMDGSSRAGAVQSVRGLGNPILGALAVFDLDHTSLVGTVAEEVLAELGLAIQTPGRPVRSVADAVAQTRDSGVQMFPSGTVGAVALDLGGLMAAGTSTGGYSTALPGRTGDSGAIGAGTFASSRAAVSCTGDGDRLLRVGLAAAFDAYLDAGLTVESAARRVLQRLYHVGGLGGFIAVTSAVVLVAQNTPVLRFSSNAEVAHLRVGTST